MISSAATSNAFVRAATCNGVSPASAILIALVLTSASGLNIGDAAAVSAASNTGAATLYRSALTSAPCASNTTAVSDALDAAAICNGVRFLPYVQRFELASTFALTAAPFLHKTSATLKAFACAARCNGVFPKSSVPSASALWVSKTSATLKAFACAARCNGVAPSISLALTSAP